MLAFAQQWLSAPPNELFADGTPAASHPHLADVSATVTDISTLDASLHFLPRSGYCLLGLAGFLDPPKADVPQAVKDILGARIAMVMITVSLCIHMWAAALCSCVF